MKQDRRILKSLAPGLFGAALAVVGMAAASTADAQVPYFKSQFAAPYVTLTGGTPVTFSNPDDATTSIPIGFTFSFYGVDYTDVFVGTNGAMSFTATNVSLGNRVLPNADTSNAMIALAWDDLHLGSGSVRSSVLGSAPNRTLVVEWNQVKRYPSSSADTITMQARLSEASGAVRLHYGPYVGPGSSTWSATVGIEDAAGVVGEMALPCGAACTVTDLRPLSGQVIEWAAPAGIELVASGRAPTGANPGDLIDISVTARNIGTLSTTTAFDAHVYFSVDDVIDATDTLLGAVTFNPPLGSRLAVTATVTTMTPTVAPGFYSIGVILDPANTVDEQIEVNNTVLLTNTFLVGSDLAAEIDTPADSGAGETVNVVVRILNLGAPQAVVPLRVVYSRDQIIDPMDTVVLTATVSVPAAPSTTYTFPIVLPAIVPAGYNAIVEIDPNNIIIEADETNNIAISPNLTTLEGPDLVAENVDATSNFAFRGGTLEVFGQIDNTGLASATGLFYGLFLSENQLCSAVSDTLLGEFGPATIGPQSTLEFTHQVMVPASLNPVEHYLCLIVNSRNTVLEGNQRNNIDRRVLPLDVRDPQPDFTVTQIRLPSRAAAGESVSIQRTLLNTGNAVSTADYVVYLSTDTTLDPMVDTLIGMQSTMLIPGQEDLTVDTLRIPPQVSGGAYYVIYVIDPADMVVELFEDNNELVSGNTLAVLPSDLGILTQSLPVATVGVMYDVVLAARGTAGAATWAIVDGVLPMGLTLDGTSGRISGTPSEEAVADLTIQVSDGGLTVSAQFTLLVASQSAVLEIATHALPPGFVGRAFQYPLTAFGGVPPYTWSLGPNDTLPEAFSFSLAGVVAGTPTDTGLIQLNVRVTDALGAFAERPFVLRVIDASDSVRMSNDVLPDGRLGEMYAETLRVASGTGASPFAFELAGGELPAGFSLEGEQVVGVPEQVGIFVFSIRVRDDRGDFDVNTYVVEIDEGEGLTFVTNSLPRGILGEDYLDEGSTVQVKAISPASTGTVSFAIVGGELPPGLEMGVDGVISGKPTSSGNFSILVLASDNLGQSDVRAYGVLIDEPAIVLPPVKTDEGGCRCVADSSTGMSGMWSFAALIGFGLFLGRRRRGLLSMLMVGACLLPSVASAQTPYFVDTRTESYTELTGGTPLMFSSNDDGQAAVVLPFAFRFFGIDYNAVNAGTNGILVFGGGSAGSLGNNVIPSPAGTNNLIAPWWDDLITNAATSHLIGTAPSRIMVIQYETVQRFGGAGGNPKFQVWLYEGPGARFEVRYGPAMGIAAGGWNASTGWENAAGDEGGSLLSCTNPNCDGSALIAAENLIVRVQADAGTDISALGVDVPVLAYAGVSFSTNVTIGSLHANPLGPFVYTVHVMDGSETVPNNPVFTSDPITLAPYQSLVTTATLAVPLNLMPARYRLALVVDSADQLMEPDEGNNVFISTDTLRLATRQPDFVVTGVDTSVPNVAPGGNFQATAYLRNRGNLAGTSDWRLVLSRNQVVSREDFLLASGTEALALLTTATVTVDVTLPAEVSAGQYYLGVVMDADNLVAEIDEVNNSGVSAAPISVATNAVNVATQALPGAYVGIAYTHFLQATGGDGDYVWSVDSGDLPTGLILVANTGEIRGMPTTVEQASVTFKVDSASQSATSSLTLDVVEPDGGITIVTRSLLPGIVGGAYPPADASLTQEMQQHIRVLGAQGAVMFTADGNLPAGLQLDTDGYLHGIPVQAGVFDVTVVASDDVGETRRTLPLTIGNPGRLTLVASTLPEGRLRQNYNYELRVIGRSQTATVTFAADGPVPPGITVSLAGLIIGVPQQVGTWIFAVTASEGQGAGAVQDSATFRFVVTQEEGFEIVETSLPFATIGEEYEADVGSRNGEPQLTWRIMGPMLPQGLDFEIIMDNQGEQKLRFRGTPEAVDTVSVLVTVVDGAGRYAQQPLTIEVREPVVVAPPVVVKPDGCTCAAPQGSNGWSTWVLALVAGAFLARRRRR